MTRKAKVSAKPVRTFAVYEVELRPTKDCVHSEPREVYVGSTHEEPGHPASARIREHREGHASGLVGKGYHVGRGRVVRSGLTSRERAEEEEIKHAERLRARGVKVWVGVKR